MSSMVPRVESVDRFRGHRVVVVLAGDLDPAAGLVAHRVVGAVVTEAQLVGVEAERAPEDLVPEADAEQRHVAEQRAHVVGRVGDGRGVAGPVGEEHAVGIAGQHLRRGRVGGHDVDRAAVREQVGEDGALDAEVVGDHREA